MIRCRGRCARSPAMSEYRSWSSTGRRWRADTMTSSCRVASVTSREVARVEPLVPCCGSARVTIVVPVAGTPIAVGKAMAASIQPR